MKSKKHYIYINKNGEYDMSPFIKKDLVCIFETTNIDEGLEKLIELCKVEETKQWQTTTTKTYKGNHNDKLIKDKRVQEALERLGRR